MLVIRRLDQWEGKAVSYKLLLDGQASGKIRNGEKLELMPSTMGSHEIAVSYLFFKSEPVRFNYDGSNIDFECGTSGDRPYLKLLGTEDTEVVPSFQTPTNNTDFDSSGVTPEFKKKPESVSWMRNQWVQGGILAVICGLGLLMFGGEDSGSNPTPKYVDTSSVYYLEVCKLPQGTLTANDRLLDAADKARDEKKKLLAANDEVAFDAWYWGKAKWSWRTDLVAEINENDKNIQCHINSDEPKKCYLVDRNGRSRSVANSINLDWSYKKAEVSLNDPNPMLNAKLSDEEVKKLVERYDSFYRLAVQANTRGDTRAADDYSDYRNDVRKELRRHRDAVSFEQRQQEGDLDQQFFPELQALRDARLTAKQNLETPKPVKWFNVIINAPTSSFRWADRSKKMTSGPVLAGAVRDEDNSSPLLAPYKPAVIWYREMTSRDSCVNK